jgi:hypothetical protein
MLFELSVMSFSLLLSFSTEDGHVDIPWANVDSVLLQLHFACNHKEQYCHKEER